MQQGIEIRVYGRVQGVWFRGSTQLQAQALQVTGWVCNEPDGSVLIQAFGTRDQLEELKSWCHQGPQHARVDHLDIREIPFENHPEFIVRRR